VVDRLSAAATVQLVLEAYLPQADFDEVFRTVLGWGGLGLIFRVYGQEFNSFRRATRSKTVCDFQLRLQETFFYTRCEARP
jgi:hypothetical protein